MFDKIRASRAFQTFWRVLQFLSAVISLGLFSARVYKLIQLGRRALAANGAVEGILAAAVAYTILVTLLQLCLRKSGAPKYLRWLLIVLDIAFVGAFIAVAVLTRPSSGPAGICYTSTMRDAPRNRNNATCKLPVGTFVLAIFSTFLHAITAIFHEVREHRDKKKEQKKLHKEYNGYDQNGHY